MPCSLALAIGPNTAILSVIDVVLFHAVPYQNPSQLVQITEKNPQGEQDGVSAGDFSDSEQEMQFFQDVAT